MSILQVLWKKLQNLSGGWNALNLFATSADEPKRIMRAQDDHHGNGGGYRPPKITGKPSNVR